jgi:hypothetical protein
LHVSVVMTPSASLAVSIASGEGTSSELSSSGYSPSITSRKRVSLFLRELI